MVVLRLRARLRLRISNPTAGQTHPLAEAPDCGQLPLVGQGGELSNAEVSAASRTAAEAVTVAAGLPSDD
ncbi:MAG: hypothetical protein OXF68_16460 [Gammaproteobacteria bacterium]|nr:hypothetical protein [Gammaproteobacteria bacterium]